MQREREDPVEEAANPRLTQHLYDRPATLELWRRRGVIAAGPARRTLRWVSTLAAVSAVLAALLVHATVTQLVPPAPTNHICGNTSLLSGPSSPPAGATTVPAGDNSSFSFAAATTYWFATGTHTLGTGAFSQISPATGSTFTGAPGAVIDGQDLNQFAFGGNNTNVTIEYLTIQNFIPPGSQGAINPNGQPDWTEEFNTEQDNLPGAATMLGTNAILNQNCMTENGEYAFNAYTINDVSSLTTGPSNITMTSNEMSFNDTCNWEDIPSGDFPITPPAGCTGAGQFDGCGCSGAGKFWAADGATITGNYVHDNYSVGLWADTNDVGFTVDNNYISGNFGDGIIYEISYNAQFDNNIFTDNAWGVGPLNPGFPSSAIYISESGSDPRVPGAYGTELDISDNWFYDNWGGVVLWENANRYCSSSANTSTGYCTLVNMTGPAPPAATIVTCDASNPSNPDPAYIDTPPGINDCRWKTQNVKVTGNIFDFTPADIGASCTAANECGFNGVFSEFGTFPPYTGTTVETNITFNQANQFDQNIYCGPWLFDAMEQGNQFSFATWQATYGQDPSSTLNAANCTPNIVPNPPGRGQGGHGVQIPIRAGRR